MTLKEVIKNTPHKLYKERKGPHSSGVGYYDIAIAFDIESTSTTYEDRKIGIMYKWQLAVHDVVFSGRTWPEFVDIMKQLQKELKTSQEKRAICWVHNLQFEYQFMKKWFNFIDVFSLKGERAVKALTDLGIEFRCSYILTNKKLEKLAEGLTEHSIKKMVGDLDYNLVRNSLTKLTKEEEGYCNNDVLILTAYIEEQMKKEHLATMPLTSTGYIRRMCKRAFRNDNAWKELMENLKLTPEIYEMNKQVYQGAVVHSNVIYSEIEQTDVGSYDFDSSYPAVMLMEENYPVSQPKKVQIKSRSQFEEYISKYCCMFTATFENIKLKDDKYISPISESKCTVLEKPIIDNGRVVEADKLTIYITEIDYDLFQKCFDWSALSVRNFYISEKGYLPTGFIRVLFSLYKDKKEMKKLVQKHPEMKMDLLLIKALLNSLYGMMATDFVYDRSIEEAINIYNNNKNTFISPLWGTYVTALARRNLFSGVCSCGKDFVYCDTDSIKILNTEDHQDYIERYNNLVDRKVKRACAHHGLNHEDVLGIGHWCFEGVYNRFKSLRAKSYMSEKNGVCELTCSGIAKSAIGYMTKKGNGDPFNFFKNGMIVPAGETGKLTHWYCEEEIEGDITDYQGNTAHFYEKSYVYLEGASYHFDYTDDYLKMLEYMETLGFRCVENYTNTCLKNN